MGILSYGYKALKAGSKAIKSVKPFSKTGGKTVEQVKQGAAKSKLDAARFNLKETFKKSDKALDKLKDTVNRVSKMGGGMMGRQMYKKGSKKAVGKSSLGMQSVIHGLDSNPKITAADPKAKFIAKNKKT
tara:strand:+ start:38 stop:427 length:390 start_codon:yes stop_codon:yes gene_type:complete